MVVENPIAAYVINRISDYPEYPSLLYEYKTEWRAFIGNKLVVVQEAEEWISKGYYTEFGELMKAKCNAI